MRSILRFTLASSLALALNTYAPHAHAADEPAAVVAAPASTAPAAAPELPPFPPGYRRLPTLPRFRFFVGASLGAEHALGGYWGAGPAVSIGAQLSELVGLDFEAHASFAYLALGGRGSVLVDFTVRPWLSIAVGPTAYSGVDFLGYVSTKAGAAYVGTVRATFRPSPHVNERGRRSGLALSAWLDAGYSEIRYDGELCPTFCQSFAIGGFVGVGYQGF